MAVIDDVWLAALTRDEDNAGSGNRFNLTINVEGTDVFAHDFSLGWNLPAHGPAGLHSGQAGLERAEVPEPRTAFDSGKLTHSSVRLGIRGDNAWAPWHVLVFGAAQRDSGPGSFVALAMETDSERWLSADRDEGRLTMPLRRVGEGSSDMPIRRILLLAYTDRGRDVGTKSAIKLQVAAGGRLVVDQAIEHDFEQVRAYWHFVDVDEPFTRADVVSGGAVRLAILGTDAWLPASVFVFGLDTATGRPGEVVTLSAVPKWDLGRLSADPSEGAASVALPSDH